MPLKWRSESDRCATQTWSVDHFRQQTGECCTQQCPIIVLQVKQLVKLSMHNSRVRHDRDCTEISDHLHLNISRDCRCGTSTQYEVELGACQRREEHHLERAVLRKRHASWKRPLSAALISSETLRTQPERLWQLAGVENALWHVAEYAPGNSRLNDMEFIIHVIKRLDLSIIITHKSANNKDARES